MVPQMCVQKLGGRSRNRSECVCLHIWGDVPGGEVSVLGSALEMCVHTAPDKCRAVSCSLGVCKCQRVCLWYGELVYVQWEFCNYFFYSGCCFISRKASGRFRDGMELRRSNSS